MDSSETDLAGPEGASSPTSLESHVSASDPAEAPAPAPDSLALRPYGFGQPAFFSSNESRKLRAQYDGFLGRLGSRLTNYLRLEVELRLQSIETIPFQKFTAALAVPTHLTLFKVEPLRGICVMELSSNVGLAIFDRLMGGTGHGMSNDRELTEIEAALIDHVVQLILDDWCVTCAPPQNCKAVLLGHETDSRYLQTSAPDSTMFVVRVVVNLGALTGQVQLAFPFSTLEPSIRSLRGDLKGAVEHSEELVAPRPLRWNKALEDMSISMTAELPPLQTPAREVAKLKVGDTLALPAEFANRIQMRLAGMLRFTGRLGTRDGRWAIEITHVSQNRSLAQL